jgi:biofilm PGA synthesis N-glycosyltransferase PgaC
MDHRQGGVVRPQPLRHVSVAIPTFTLPVAPREPAQPRSGRALEGLAAARRADVDPPTVGIPTLRLQALRRPVRVDPPTVGFPTQRLPISVCPVAPHRETGRRRAPTSTAPRTARVVALVPAHNEEAGIVDTVRSLHRQTRRPDRIVVITDNCTDRTAALARSMGAQVLATVANSHKKAGALNQALRVLLADLADDDVVLTMDADSELAADFVEVGLRYLAFSPRRGAVSGSYTARSDASVIGLMQRVEFAQGLHVVHGRGGRVHVLSGAACMATAQALKAVARARGSAALPGPRGWVYHEESLTEDYELTVALKRIGYEPLNARDCIVVTDVMRTWREWAVQRLRWQRGTLETLAMYGWVPPVRSAWFVQIWTYFRSVLPLLMVLFWAYAALFESVHFNLAWLAILPVFVLDQLVAAWRAGGRGRLLAVLLVPMWIYDTAQLAVYWKALRDSLRSAEATWVT